MRRSFWQRHLCMLALVAVASCQSNPRTSVPPPPDLAKPAQEKPLIESLKLAANRAGAFVRAADSEGVPHFMVAVSPQSAPPGLTPASAARWHLNQLAAAQNLTPGAVNGAELVRVARLGPNAAGGILVHLRQRVDDIEIYPSDVKVLMRPNLDLYAVSGRLRAPVVTSHSFKLTPADALAQALGHLSSTSV